MSCSGDVASALQLVEKLSAVLGPPVSTPDLVSRAAA
jgi:hypothetical protein